MRRLITIPLLTIYLLASIGFHGVNHFCTDQMVTGASSQMDMHNSEDQCDMVCKDDVSSCCNQPENNSECCTDVNFIVFFETESPSANYAKRYLVKIPSIAGLSSFRLNDSDLSFLKWFPNVTHLPSTPHATPLYIKHQSLIFYG